MKYADIIVDISHEKLDKVYQYRIPEDLEEKVFIGVQVNISFGNRFIKGYVVNITTEASYDVDKIKDISGVVENSVAIESQLINLAYFIKENFGATMNDAIKTVIPVKHSVKEVEKRNIKLLISDEELEELISINEQKKNVARVRFLKAFENKKELDYTNVTRNLKIAKNTITYFEKNSIISVVSKTMYRNPIKKTDIEQRKIELNEEQRTIVEDFCFEYKNHIRDTYLIFGVTGSGKTEVYIEMIEEVISSGKQVIVLIPEISLTYQTVKRFYNRFGDRISIMNSRMSSGERYDQYLRAKNGNIDIMIGPRSALFTPFERLGLIIIDEEHESSYKSELSPKYHAREVAIERARTNNASIVLGSATPSLESYYKALRGEYKLYKMVKRAQSAKLPTVHIVDLREELKNGNKSIFSKKLYELILDRLDKKEQVMLFINRRGYSGFVSCRSCGKVIKCPHCDISLTYHKNNTLVCHYCGYQQEIVKRCPECNSDFIALFGTGTQKIEDMVKRVFTTAKVLRMDADTTSKKQGHEQILTAFANKEADILVGTQMIVKGHDFPNVTLVGILAADLSLNVNDYRAAEKTFQLLTQASGRAGRGKKEGEVVIQTYRPNHYSITTSAENDYEKFYEQEILYRKIAKYPPVSNILLILVTSRNEDSANEMITEIEKNVKLIQSKFAECKIIGPTDAMLTKAHDMYRKVIYLKAENYNLLVNIKNIIDKSNKTLEIYKKCSVYYDFNPINTY